jgi:hypothetical protein
MKNLTQLFRAGVFTALLACSVGGAAFAQNTVGVYGQVAIPTGKDADAVNLGFGGGVLAKFGIGGPNLRIPARFEVNYFSGKGLGSGVTGGSTFLNFQSGVHYHFMPEGPLDFYAGLEIGYARVTSSISGGGITISSSANGFIVYPTIGLEYGLGDGLGLTAHVAYSSTTASSDNGSGSSTSATSGIVLAGIGINYKFGF